MAGLASAAPPGVEFGPAEWSPTRTEIAFWATVDGQAACGRGTTETALFVVRPDGRDLRRVDWPSRGPKPWDDVQEDMERIWSPDGNRLAFTGVDYSGREDFYVIVVTRAGELVLKWGYAEPTEWAPDSRRLAVFLYDPTASPTGPAVLDVRTRHEQQIGLYLSSGLAWSPRGDLVAYLHAKYVYVERPNGTSRHRLVAAVLADWSGDGTLLAFAKPRGKRWSAGYVIRPNGRNLRRMPGAPTNWSWSPRGRTYAFGRELYNFATKRRWRVLPRKVEVSKPIWSPNGRRLAYSSVDELFVADRSGRHGQVIRWPEAQRVSDPSWSRDARALTFTTEDGLYVVRADGRQGHYVPLRLCDALAAQS